MAMKNSFHFLSWQPMPSKIDRLIWANYLIVPVKFIENIYSAVDRIYEETKGHTLQIQVKNNFTES